MWLTDNISPLCEDMTAITSFLKPYYLDGIGLEKKQLYHSYR